MTRTHSPQQAAGGAAAHRVRALARTVSRYLLPFVASLSGAALWLALMSIVNRPRFSAATLRVRAPG